MSSTKQKIKVEVGAMNVGALCKAIEKIPCKGGRFKASEAFGSFIQHALVVMVEGNRETGEPLFLTDAQFRKLGFTPIDPDVPLPGQDAIGTAVTAYFEAVRDNEPFTDLLTPVHAHFLGQYGGEGLGQYFTPWDLAKLAAALSVDHSKRHGRPAPLRINDPCCGAGGLLLAAIQDDLARFTNHDERFAAAFSLHVHANDIDPLCSAMTALQLTTNQLIHSLALGEVRIEVGDTLTKKVECVFKTKSRFALSRGVASFGTPAKLADLLILDALDGVGVAKSKDECTLQVITNPPFGKGAMAAWDRAWPEIRKQIEEEKAA